MAIPDIVTFGIPLIGKSVARDWSRVVHQLNATIGSIYNQTDPNFRIVIACTDRPELGVPTDERLEFLHVEQMPATGHDALVSDSARKSHRVAQRLRVLGGGYLMLTDADDLISARLVDFVRRDRHPNGYLVSHGYGLDAGRGTLTPLPLPDTTRRFDDMCGTCSVLLFSPEELPVDDSDYRCRYARLLRDGNPSVGTYARAEGRPMVDLPFRAVVYVRNTGENLSRISTITTLVDRFQQFSYLHEAAKAAEIEQTPEIEAEFNLAAATIGPEPAVLDADPAAAPISLCVLIATYRRPDGLRRLLAALRPQVEGREERHVVVVNDGSHDQRYAAVAAEFADMMTYRSFDGNQGLIAARNAGVAESRAAYSVFVDDDCEPPPWWLDWLSARLQRHPEIDVVGGQTLPRWTTRSFTERVQGTWFLPHPSYIGDRALFVTANVAIRTDMVRAVGGFGFPHFTGAGEDTELGIRLHRAGARFLIDWDWWVAHDVDAPLGSIRRKYRKYGIGNARLPSVALLTLVPPVGVRPEQMGRYSAIWPLVRHYWENARSFKGSRPVQIAAGLIAAGIQATYIRSLLKAAGKPPPRR